MSEHTYPKHMPKDDVRPSVRIAWRILDSVVPGRIPVIIRYQLAEQIANACAGIDQTALTMVRAIELCDFFTKMDEEQVRKIAEISPELVESLCQVGFQAAKAKEAANNN